MACQGHQAPLALQALLDARVFQAVMERMAQKGQWDYQGLQGHLAFLGNLERRVYLDFQAGQGPLVPQVPEVNLGHLQVWTPVLESQGFLEFQAHEDQKEPWGPQESKGPRDQGAKENLGQMAGGVRMAFLGHRGLLDTEATVERLDALAHQVLLVQLVILAPKGMGWATSAASS